MARTLPCLFRGQALRHYASSWTPPRPVLLLEPSPCARRVDRSPASSGSESAQGLGAGRWASRGDVHGEARSWPADCASPRQMFTNPDPRRGEPPPRLRNRLTTAQQSPHVETYHKSGELIGPRRPPPHQTDPVTCIRFALPPLGSGFLTGHDAGIGGRVHMMGKIAGLMSLTTWLLGRWSPLLSRCRGGGHWRRCGEQIGGRRGDLRVRFPLRSTGGADFRFFSVRPFSASLSLPPLEYAPRSTSLLQDLQGPQAPLRVCPTRLRAQAGRRVRSAEQARDLAYLARAVQDPSCCP